MLGLKSFVLRIVIDREDRVDHKRRGQQRGGAENRHAPSPVHIDKTANDTQNNNRGYAHIPPRDDEKRGDEPEGEIDSDIAHTWIPLWTSLAMISTNPTFAGAPDPAPKQVKGLRKRNAPARHLFTDPLVAYSVTDVKQAGGWLVTKCGQFGGLVMHYLV